jgi:hypothetical protein
MPKCLNHTGSYFRGTEPSPKGRGFCARGENVGKKMRGQKDRKMWVVKKTSNGVKRWVPCVSSRASKCKRKKSSGVEKKASKDKGLTDFKGGGMSAIEAKAQYLKLLTMRNQLIFQIKHKGASQVMAGRLQSLNSTITHHKKLYGFK